MHRATITETNRIRLVLIGMRNRALGPYLAAINWILASIMRLGAPGRASPLGRPTITETNGIRLVLIGMRNMALGP
jgi:hypothetical protein